MKAIDGDAGKMINTDGQRTGIDERRCISGKVRSGLKNAKEREG